MEVVCGLPLVCEGYSTTFTMLAFYPVGELSGLPFFLSISSENHRFCLIPNYGSHLQLHFTSC